MTDYMCPADPTVTHCYHAAKVNEIIRTHVAEITSLRAENERLKKRVEWHEHALHTCHDECDKPLCKATRDVERLTAEIASLTEEFGIQNNDLGKALLENERLRAELREMDAHMEENITLTEALRHEQEWVLRLSKALRGIIRVADRNTVEFNEARAALGEKP